MKKVILVDDEKLVAEAIRRQVDWESCGAVLCRVCLNAFEALKAVEEVRPDIICLLYTSQYDILRVKND